MGFADIYNANFFSNMLDLWTVDLQIEELDTEVGYCIPEDGGTITLGIANEFDSYAVFESTLVHELVHVWQIQCMDEQPNHGWSFDKMKTYISGKYFIEV